jgi:hypothetical protein
MSDTDKSELERIVGNIITACYDVNQTKPGVIKVVDKSMADLQALITQQCNQARIALLNDLKQVTFNAVMGEKDAHGAIEDYIAAELAQAKETEEE